MAERRKVKFLGHIKCWLLGHDQSGNYYHCDDCNSYVDYHDYVMEGVVQRIEQRLESIFGVCKDCKKRFGNHSDCIPF